MTDTKPTRDEMVYNMVVDNNKRLRSIEHRLTVVEVRSGFIGALAAATVVLMTKIGVVFAWLNGGK